MNHRAQEIIAKLGYPARTRDRVGEFSYDTDLLSYLSKHGGPRPDWNLILSQRPTLLNFWYRQSPTEMISEGWWNAMTPGVVGFGTGSPSSSPS